MESPTLTNPNLTNLPGSQATFSYKDILVGKLAKAVASSVISQSVILVLYIFFVNINLLHPIEWMSTSLNTFTYFSTWLFVIIFSSIIFAQSIICAKDYVLMSSYCSTRFQQFIHILSIHNFTLLTLHVIIGGAFVWQILSLSDGDFRYLLTTCDSTRYCLVTDAFFLIVGGFYMGFYFFLKIYVASKHLVFPVIQQKKFLRFRTNILHLFKDSFTMSIWPTIYFVVFYYFWGNQLEHRFMYLLNLEKLPSDSSVLLYVYCWWFSSLYFFSMILMTFFFHLFLTESVQFPLVKENAYILTLQEALRMNNLPIIQNLACLDLFLFAQWFPHRRQMLFTLSQPGGHPHNWNMLIESLLHLFTEYTNMLKKSTESPLVQEQVKRQTEVYSPFSPIQSPYNSCTNLKFRNLRNMSCINDDVDVVNVSHSTPDNVDVETIKQKIEDRLQKVIAFLKVFLGINFLFGELPQVNIQKCLGNGQLIIWASQGISELATVSLIEDKYGIVQKDLPVIITTLVQLKQQLDKLNKVPALSRKVAALDDFNYKMKNAVSAAVRRSLFNICLNFGQYFNSFSLNQETLQYLQVNIMLKNSS